MVDQRQQFGKAGESIAARFLRKMGYRILEQNYRTVLGEIDIIARDRDTLVFVEVKARTSGRYGNPKSA
ncbi:MAG: YraN family protein, partial [Desulfobacterales bacterium]|nr:YraN family protein [Desulfobacterales bacterium]